MEIPFGKPAWGGVEPHWAALDCWRGVWTTRSWLNTPGPFYTGGADFACLGPQYAGSLVSMDAEAADVVFRQPVTAEELSVLVEAAKCDPFSGYACDGNERWSVSAVRRWWERREAVRQHVVGTVLREDWYPWESLRPVVLASGRRWLAFLDDELEGYLRSYCYVLQHRDWPRRGAALPRL
jgi:hypothetical protein